MHKYEGRTTHQPLMPSVSRRRLLAGIGTTLLGGGAARIAAGQDIATPVTTPGATPAATPLVPAGDAWPLYGRDLSGTKATTTAGLSSANVSALVPIWEVAVAGPVSATPVIADGVAYAGSYDGSLSALDLMTGEQRWVYETGAAVPEPNLQIPLGITGSAAVVGDTVYVGDAAAMVHAVDVATGEARWTTSVDEQPNASIWSSPVVANDRLYVGIASVAKEVGFRGSVVALDAISGELVWQTFMVPEGADGAGVFAVPAIDRERGLLYVGTQNAYSPNAAPYGNPISIVALEVETGGIAWAFNAPPNSGETAPTDDVGFSASPNLLSAEIDGQPRDLVGEGQKSGEFWALDRGTGDVVWQATVSPAGFLGGMEGTSAVSDGIIAVPATDWPEFEGPASGMVTGLATGTGEQRWTTTQDAPAASPAAISDDLVFHAGMDSILHAYALTDGEELWRFDLGASVSGGIAVANGVVVLGAATPQFAPFVRPGSLVRAFGIGIAPGTPVSATPVT
jgi:polyvinyl alcohol dehydrogenase (cytochrome)